MLYQIKRQIRGLYKNVCVYFETVKRHKEISRAYGSDSPSFSVSIPPRLVVNIGILCVIIIVISLGVIYKKKGISLFQVSTQQIQQLLKQHQQSREKKQKLIKENKAQVIQKDTIEMVDSPAEIDTVPRQMAEEIPVPVVEHKVDITKLQKNFLSYSEEMHCFILANKGTKIMNVLFKENDTWSVVRRYSVAIGKTEGRKMRSGDKKTPEGLYFIVGRKERSELHQKYGPLVFVLNYPNEDDKKFGRTGLGIWIHGTNPDSLPFDTRGCLELENKNIVELGNLLKTGIGTPVLIVNQDTINQPEILPDYIIAQSKRIQVLKQYNSQRVFFATLLENWRMAWESRNISNYSYYYNEDKFYGQGMKWDAWKERKSRTFDNYSRIEVSLDKIFLSDFSESTAVLKFLQAYESPTMNVVNGKKLDFIKTSGNWKIFKENSCPKEELLL